MSGHGFGKEVRDCLFFVAVYQRRTNERVYLSVFAVRRVVATESR